MKKITIFLFIIATIGFMIFGKISYGNKVEKQVASAVDGSISDKVNKPSEKKTNNQEESIDLSISKNLPKNIQDKLANNQKVTITLLGSNGDSDYYAPKVKAAVETAYGSLVTVTSTDIEGTSNKIRSSTVFEAILKDEPDLVLWEVPLLSDNGVLSHETTLQAVSHVYEDLVDKGIQLALQPMYPLYKAVNYPKQEKALSEYANAKGLPYLEHWEQWPDINSSEFLNYVDSDGETPNEQGQEVWIKAITAYFIAE